MITTDFIDLRTGESLQERAVLIDAELLDFIRLPTDSKTSIAEELSTCLTDEYMLETLNKIKLRIKASANIREYKATLIDLPNEL